MAVDDEQTGLSVGRTRPALAVKSADHKRCRLAFSASLLHNPAMTPLDLKPVALALVALAVSPAAAMTATSSNIPSPPSAGSSRDITVQRGQSLTRIARDYHVPMNAIIAANHLRPPYRLLIGEHLTIPVAPADRLQDIAPEMRSASPSMALAPVAPGAAGSPRRSKGASPGLIPRPDSPAPSGAAGLTPIAPPAAATLRPSSTTTRASLSTSPRRLPTGESKPRAEAAEREQQGGPVRRTSTASPLSTHSRPPWMMMTSALMAIGAGLWIVLR